ncbi:MAG: ribosome recycling factor [Magnetococcales bacterium]|nr:ribosome recycling factor [Magnetococcales bacterium]MBF0172440.1 ribosome recycling factor [Magnetococcales bacterium]MBF0347723.1 ribosome recycling factor [Magnetococcales bacterium]MBF0631384.1 ribosome recycling factor [Magnetococcales bacterium]
MVDPLLKTLDSRMKKALAAFKDELAGIRTGRASSSLLEHLPVEAYGATVPLNQLAAINVPEARMITVQPWDKSTTKAVEKAIQESDLGLNPMNDGELIRVPLPELTEDRRRELVKVVHKLSEQGKVALRNIRRDGMDQAKKMEKAKKISMDDLRQMEKKIQEQTDQFIKEVDHAVVQKETDIMQL